VAGFLRKPWTGAPHATEIPFVFDTVAAYDTEDQSTNLNNAGPPTRS